MRAQVLALSVALLWSNMLAPAQAGTAECGQPVCLVARDSLALAHIITFDDVASSMGLGRPIDTLLTRPGARFGERFAGQILMAEGDFDRVGGAAFSPLTVIPGAPGQTLGAMRLPDTTVLQGLGNRSFPMIEAAGEGMIAVEFEDDQAALAFDLRGGEAGSATVVFLRRDGREISRLTIGPLGEDSYGFLRSDWAADIAGFLIFNADPQGVAIDNLAFDDTQLTG